MNEHTPGPWIAQNHYVVSDRHERLEVIAVCGGRETLNWACDPCDIENTANTMLLAAAPDLESILRRLAEKVKRANDIQHSGGRITAEDWSELYMLTNEAGDVLSKARG